MTSPHPPLNVNNELNNEK